MFDVGGFHSDAPRAGCELQREPSFASLALSDAGGSIGRLSFAVPVLGGLHTAAQFGEIALNTHTLNNLNGMQEAYAEPGTSPPGSHASLWGQPSSLRGSCPHKVLFSQDRSGVALASELKTKFIDVWGQKGPCKLLGPAPRL